MSIPATTSTMPPPPEVAFAETEPSLELPGRYRSFGATHCGKIRPNNQDQFLIAGMRKAIHVRQSSFPQPHTQYSEEKGQLLVVADGMGGHEGGEQASALAVRSIEDFLLHAFHWVYCLEGTGKQTILQEFQEALRQADAKVLSESAIHPELHGMGTTVTIACIVDKKLFVAHVGDSRCYLSREGQLHQLTKDHTLVQEMVRAGKLAPELAEKHTLRSVITNVVGGTEKGVVAEVHRVDLEPGDKILLCTDGLTNMVKDSEIQKLLESTPDKPEAICDALIHAANNGGGRDNITVIIAIV